MQGMAPRSSGAMVRMRALPRQHAGIFAEPLRKAIAISPWMNAAAFFAEEWSFEMNPQDFGSGYITTFILLWNVFRNAFDCMERVVRGSSDGRGDDGGRSKLRNAFGDDTKRIGGAFHDVASPLRECARQ